MAEAKRVGLITTIPAPYRIPVFNFLAEKAPFDFEVIFLARREKRRGREFATLEGAKFRHKFAFGFQVPLTPRKMPFYLNLGVGLEARSYDVVVCGGYTSPASVEALALSRVLGRKFILWSESTNRDWRPSSFFREAYKRSFVRACFRFIVPGRAAKEYLLSLGADGERIWVAPNAVDVGFFSSVCQRLRGRKEEIKREEGITEEKVALYVGRMIDAKGVPFLLRAFFRVRRRLGGVALVLVGSGPKEGEYRRVCREEGVGGVYFAGFRRGEELVKFYALADVFVFPSLTDPWGMVVNEALACGLPVITTPCPGAVDDMVFHGVNGLIVGPGSVRELEEALLDLFCCEERRKEMAEKARLIGRLFTPERCACGFVEAILGRRNESYLRLGEELERILGPTRLLGGS